MSLRPLAVAVVLVLPLTGCGDDDGGGGGEPGPYDGIEASETIRGGGMIGWADVVRDEFGVPHVYARHVEDLAFAQGYVMAADRMQQMHLFRHVASGRVAELFGALDRGQIDADIEMRLHRFLPLAEEAWAELVASSAESDREIVRYLERFSDGINAYLADLRAGRRTLDPAVQVWFDPERAADWTPVDSLVIGRLQAFSLSYGDHELDLTDLAQRAAQVFDGADADAQPGRAARAGIFADLLPIRPMDTTSTIDGWPGEASAAAPAPAFSRRPAVPAELAERLRWTQAPRMLGKARLDDPRNGSNSWVVGPDLAGGATLMANDPHLTLMNPSVFYAVHLTVPGELDVAGITFPGVPGVVLGHNEHLAWGATTANHDVTDFYLEEVVPCATGGGDCVVFEGGEVPLETWTEELRIGANGTITETMTVTFERVPHHGPLLPEIVDHAIAPRTGDAAISVRYTGHLVTRELAAFQGLWRATTVEEGIAALEAFGFGAQNFVLADDQGNIGWTTQALVPLRTDGCYTWDPDSNPDGVAPWFVVPGDGSCEWDGWMAPADIPHAVNPDKGYLVTANADPVGASFDGNPLNEPRSGGRLLYAGWGNYAAGFRAGRITRRLEALIDAGAPLTREDMAAIQADTFSNFGHELADAVVTAVARLDDADAPDDVKALAASLSAADQARLSQAAARLSAWSYETPAAVGDAGDAAIADSSATVIFNGWVVYFLRAAFRDETALLGRNTNTWVAPLARAALLAPDTLATGLAPETGEPLLCDDLGTADVVESCTGRAILALHQALAWASGSQGFGTADLGAWRWGHLHRVTLGTILPADELDVPPRNDPNPALAGGYPRAGDTYSVDASSPGYGDFDFRYSHGPAMRHITELRPGQPPVSLLALPGGQIFDRASPHYRDLMDRFWASNEYFVLPWSTAEVIAAAETRWRFE